MKSARTYSDHTTIKHYFDLWISILYGFTCILVQTCCLPILAGMICAMYYSAAWVLLFSWKYTDLHTIGIHLHTSHTNTDLLPSYILHVHVYTMLNMIAVCMLLLHSSLSLSLSQGFLLCWGEFSAQMEEVQ